MPLTCKSLKRSDGNIAVWVAISTSVLFMKPNHPSPHHHPIAAGIAAFAVILIAGIVAWLYCHRRKSA